MNAIEFCYWLHGLLKVGNPAILNKEQIDVIYDHLDSVLNKQPMQFNPDLYKRITITPTPWFQTEPKFIPSPEPTTGDGIPTCSKSTC